MLFICCLFSICFAQIKVNKGRDVDIVLTDTKGFIVRNNTNITYVIDPQNFYGIDKIMENSHEAPLMIYPSGYYRRNKKLCKEDIIVLAPYESKKASIVMNQDLTGQGLDVFKISSKFTYTHIFKSVHNKTNLLNSDCKDYIQELERSGYKVLEDSISVTIPYFPDFSYSKEK